MRLIDADDFKEDLKAVTLSNGTSIVNVNNIIFLLDKYKTAYDIDKVVDELEDFRAEMKQFGCEGMLSDMLEVIKHGVVYDDVCEWKGIEKEYMQNPHTKRLYSNEPSMRNVYCNTCGKKIKVVE